MYYLGNQNLITLPKTAFLCSRRYPAAVVLKAYDWAGEQKKTGRCVISGFHSDIEKDVLHFLLKGSQPVIMVLARSMNKTWDDAVSKALSEERLLIISPFDENIKRGTEGTAAQRNRLMAQMADEVMIAHSSPGGKLEKLAEELKQEGKKLSFLSA
jgi:predicted Rossmann fold nucleotide-binding protein DprA/Smf involved in DNA uptake